MRLKIISLFLVLAQLIIGDDSTYIPKDRFILINKNVNSGDNSIKNEMSGGNSGGNLIAVSAGTPTCMGMSFSTQTSYKIDIGDYYCKAKNAREYYYCAIVIHLWIYLTDYGNVLTIVDSGNKLSWTKADNDKFTESHSVDTNQVNIPANKNKWTYFFFNAYNNFSSLYSIFLISKEDDNSHNFEKTRSAIDITGSIYFGAYLSDLSFKGLIYLVEIMRDFDMPASPALPILDETIETFDFYSWSCNGSCTFCPAIDKNCIPSFCRPCSDECNNCNGSKCADCVDSNAAVDSSGNCICNNGYYKNASLQCVKCLDNCDRCTGAGQCTFCKLGYYYTGTSCVKCGCDTCNSSQRCYKCGTLVVTDGSSCVSTSVGYELSFESPYIVIDFAYPTSVITGIASITATSESGDPITTTGWATESCTTTQCKIKANGLSVNQLPLNIAIDFATTL